MSYNKRKTMKYLRSMLGLSSPHKNKRSKTSYKKNNLLPRKNYNATAILNKKPLTPVERGLVLSNLGTSLWKSQSNLPPVYVFDRRVHHGELGVLVGLYGLYKNDPELFGIGLGLALDDIHDVNEWFTFKPRNSFDTHTQSQHISVVF